MEDEDIFVEARENNDDDCVTEIKLDDQKVVTQSSPPRTSVTQIPPISKKEKPVIKSGQFIDISIDYPEKYGSGMGSYFVYKITTKTNRPSFLRQEMCVRRRFSDFLGLHSRLQQKYLSAGFIIPAAPEKDAIGNTKLLISKEDQTNSEFIGRRRASLERFLQRIARHPVFVIDSDFREFLEEDKDLPKAVNTQMLSGENVKKLFRNVGGLMGNIVKKVEDCDQWFENKQTEMESLEKHFNEMHISLEQLVSQRRELAVQTKAFAQFCCQLSHVEENNGLARALGHLSTTKEEISTIEEKEAEVEFYAMLELVKDYVGMIGSVKDALGERMRLYKVWQDEETSLTKKRDQKVRCEMTNKSDKIAGLEQEIKECETRVERTKEDFEKISSTIKKEMDSFNVMTVDDFKRGMVRVLESMLQSQESVVRHWEAFGPEVVGISSS